MTDEHRNRGRGAIVYRRAALTLLAASLLAGCGGDARPGDGAGAEDAPGAEYDPMRMEGDDSIHAEARARAHSDSVRDSVMAAAGIPPGEDPAAPPPPPPATQSRADCLASVEGVDGGERDVLRTACMRLPETP